MLKEDPTAHFLMEARKIHESLGGDVTDHAAKAIVEYPLVSVLVGVDEVGRGPLAGPVVTCAVLWPDDHGISELNDSKKLSAKEA